MSVDAQFLRTAFRGAGWSTSSATGSRSTLPLHGQGAVHGAHPVGTFQILFWPLQVAGLHLAQAVMCGVPAGSAGAVGGYGWRTPEVAFYSIM